MTVTKKQTVIPDPYALERWSYGLMELKILLLQTVIMAASLLVMLVKKH